MDTLSAPDPSHDGGKAASSLVLGLVAAAAGALGWAAVTYFTRYELGYVAWALGALVGATVVRFGGRGPACAVAAGVLTVAAIAGGKLLATRVVVEQDFRDYCEETFTPELHAELVVDAADLAELEAEPDDAVLRSFLVDHAYTPARSPDDVQGEELEAFRSYHAPRLRELHAERTSYPDWHARSVAESRADFDREFSLVQAEIEMLGPMDVLFLVLGVGTAVGLVRRASAGEEPGRGDSDGEDQEPGEPV